MKPDKKMHRKPVQNAHVEKQNIAAEFVRIGRLTNDRKIQEAWKAANALHNKHPKDATVNFAAAVVLVENKQHADALSFAEAAVKFAPDNAGYLVFLGKLYIDLQLIEHALPLLIKAHSMDKNLFQAPWALGRYYFGIGQGSKALPYFEQALQSAPGPAQDNIRFDCAGCLAAMGRVAEAEALYSALVNWPEARISALVFGAGLRKNDQVSDYADKVRKELQNSGLSNRARSELLLCLGRLHENGREYDAAFEHFSASRKLLKSRYDAQSFRAKVDDLINVMSRDVFERLRGYGHASAKPIFVVGMPRSGTTMTEQIIAAHSQAEGAGELPRMDRMMGYFSEGKGPRGIVDKMEKVGPDRWRDVPQQYLGLLDAMAPGVARVVDKMPHNFLQIGFIHLCFPNAKIVHCRRNPLDNFISAIQNEMNANHGYSYDQEHYGTYYLEYLRLMEHWKSVLPGSIHESRYEQITANPETEVRNLLAFLDLPWEEECLRFHERDSTVNTPSRMQVRNAINTGSVARWKRYEKHLGPIMKILEDAGVPF